MALGTTRLLIAKKFAHQPFTVRERYGPVEVVSTDLEAPSLTSEEILKQLEPEENLVLVLPGDLVIDPRALRALVRCGANSTLIDSAVPTSQAESSELLEPLELLEPSTTATATAGSFLCGPTLLDRNWLESHEGPLWPLLPAAIADGSVSTCDLATISTYAPELRKHLRPYCYRVRGENQCAENGRRAEQSSSAPNMDMAKQLLLDSTQKGALDIPAHFHAPIEKFAAWRLADTAVTPNQITGLTTLLAWIATWQFAVGNLLVGIGIALAVGVLDGVDGKLARLRIETSKVGELEHWLDFLYEWSWWVALAYHFSTSGALPNAWGFLGILAVAEVVDGLMKLSIIRTFGRTIDEMSSFDRSVRLVGGRRNIYVWILASWIIGGRPEFGFMVIPWLEAGTALIHAIRAPWLILTRRNMPLSTELETSKLEASQ
jgi:phosphatidylglycerophosphate synthase